MKLKSKLNVWLLSAVMSMAALPSSASAQSGAQASQHLSAASAIVVLGGMSVLAAGGEMVVTGIEHSARGVSVMVRHAGEASAEVASLLVDGATAASLAVGRSVQVSATGVGYVLLASGKAIAFIPNEIGQSLIHQSRYSR